jgi:hypothetical protein
VGPRSRIGNVTGRLNVHVSAAESELAVIAKRLETRIRWTGNNIFVFALP